MNHHMVPLPSLSPVVGKNFVVEFDGGILRLREIEGHLPVAGRVAACIEDPRACNHVTRCLNPHASESGQAHQGRYPASQLRNPSVGERDDIRIIQVLLGRSNLATTAGRDQDPSHRGAGRPHRTMRGLRLKPPGQQFLLWAKFVMGSQQHPCRIRHGVKAFLLPITVCL
jgi:hypothetical protein